MVYEWPVWGHKGKENLSFEGRKMNINGMAQVEACWDICDTNV